MILLAVLGCAAPLGDAASVCAFEYEVDTLDDPARTIGVLVDDDGGDVYAQLRWPDETPREGDRWPVVVVLRGGWSTKGTPVDEALPHVEVTGGIVAVHLDFPGGSLSEGTDDRRGPEARRAVATALRYAGGGVLDRGGCGLADRVLGADVDDVYLLGVSNGGNLAVATLGDPNLDLDPPRGLVTWETPVGAPFATIQYGGSPSVYTPGTCALDETSTILCATPAEPLVLDAAGLCFDVDGDGACVEGADAIVEGVTDPATGLVMVAPELVGALDDAGVDHPTLADASDARVWWKPRDAAYGAPGMVAAWPELPVMILGTKDDHVLGALGDHPHIYGFGEALQRAGVAWLRLNPGREWLDGETPANEPDAPMRLSEPDLSLLSEEDETPLEALLAAAVTELSERHAADSW